MTDNSNDIFTYGMSDNAILGLLGQQIKQMRLNRNLTQSQLSSIAGVSRSTISDLEQGNRGALSSLIQILRALNKLEVLNSFITNAAISPLQIAKSLGKKRKRASGKNKINNLNEGPEW